MRLCVWSPGIIHGLLQTEDYARALIAVVPGVAVDTMTARIASRMELQRHVLDRDDPPRVWFVVDKLSLYRDVGSATCMAAQIRHLIEVARMPNVTVQVLPAIAHNANASGFIVAGDNAAYAEHVAGGYVFTDEQTVNSLAVLFDSLRGECYRTSESVALLERMALAWETGASPLTRTETAETA